MALNPVIFVVDDDEAVRDSMSLLMESVGLPVQTYASGQAFIEDYQEQQPGCLILDIRMPGMSGIALQKQLIERKCSLPIIFITGHGDIPMAVEAIKRGAADFLTKPFRDQDLLDRIEQVLREEHKNIHTLQHRQLIQLRIAQLTPRETEILQRMVAGMANKVIAMELDISQRTIEVHRARVMKKMQVHSIAELVRMVVLAEQ